MQTYQYSKNDKQEGTKAVILTEAGFSLADKKAYYIQDSTQIVYFSQTSLNIGLKTGLIKLLN